MAEEKNRVPLNDDELENISGGAGITDNGLYDPNNGFNIRANAKGMKYNVNAAKNVYGRANEGKAKNILNAQAADALALNALEAIK